jgi:hypothetical protein
LSKPGSVNPNAPAPTRKASRREGKRPLYGNINGTPSACYEKLIDDSYVLATTNMREPAMGIKIYSDTGEIYPRRLAQRIPQKSRRFSGCGTFSGPLVKVALRNCGTRFDIARPVCNRRGRIRFRIRLHDIIL